MTKLCGCSCTSPIVAATPKAKPSAGLNQLANQDDLRGAGAAAPVARSIALQTCSGSGTRGNRGGQFPESDVPRLDRGACLRRIAQHALEPAQRPAAQRPERVLGSQPVEEFGALVVHGVIRPGTS